MISALLNSALLRAETLSEATQNELAEQFIEDIESEIKWKETLSKPLDNPNIVELAQKALIESFEGKTEKIGFDEL